jgi:protein-S-isoprenylcysteine O-methyltransferase Ste14
MNPAILLLGLANFALIGALPFCFFKKSGKFNAMWWLTAAPFFFCPGFLTAAFLGLISPAVRPESWLGVLLQFGSLVSSIVSIALIFFALGCHRIPIALWHQVDDAPESIVTYGPYQRVRHPFYAAFLLACAGAFLLAPQWGPLLTLIYALLTLNFTAANEERRLAGSRLGAEYQNYLRQTGRFWPRWRRSQT